MNVMLKSKEAHKQIVYAKFQGSNPCRIHTVMPAKWQNMAKMSNLANFASIIV